MAAMPLQLDEQRLAATATALTAQSARTMSLLEGAHLPSNITSDLAQLRGTLCSEASAAAAVAEEVHHLANVLPELTRRNGALRAEVGRLKRALLSPRRPGSDGSDWRTKLPAAGRLPLQKHYLAPPLSAPKTRVEAAPDDKRVAMVWGVSETTRHMVRGLLRARGGWTFTRDARRPDVALQWAPLTEIVWDRGWPASPRAAHLSPPFPLQVLTRSIVCQLILVCSRQVSWMASSSPTTPRCVLALCAKRSSAATSIKPLGNRPAPTSVRTTHQVCKVGRRFYQRAIRRLTFSALEGHMPLSRKQWRRT